MSVQPGNRSSGYDPSLTLAEQRALLVTKQAAATRGTTQHNSLTQKIADIDAKVAETAATVARAVAEEAAERAKNPTGLVAQRLMTT